MTELADAINRMGQLVENEHELECRRRRGRRQPERGVTRSVEVALDHLLRRRRARLAAGDDPDSPPPRPPEIVERYQQWAQPYASPPGPVGSVPSETLASRSA